MATIQDVARHAGVSASTVSYVLSGNRPISEETRRRVEDSISELAFVRHAGAHSIKSRTTNVIALVMPLDSGQDTTIQMPLVASILQAARGYGYNILLMTADDDLETVAGSSMIDGAIVMEIRMRDARIPALRKLNRPSVLIGSLADMRQLTAVDMDIEGDIDVAVSHLAELGHRRIGYIGHPQDLYEREVNFAVRSRRAFAESCSRHALDGRAVTCEASTEGVRRALDELEAGGIHDTGLVVYNEAALPLVISELGARGLSIPEDVSLVAICPLEQARRHAPAITCVPVLAEALGQRAVDLLVGKVGGARDELVRIPSHLVLGETTGRAA